MVLLGLLLIAAAAVVGVEVVRVNMTATDVSAFGTTITGYSLGSLFLAGVAAGVLACLGLWMIKAGLARSRRRRLERKNIVNERETIVTEKESELDDLAVENERLRAEIEAERRERLTMGGVAVPPGVDGSYGDQISDTVYKERVAEPYPSSVDLTGDTPARSTADTPLYSETAREQQHH